MLTNVACALYFILALGSEGHPNERVERGPSQMDIVLSIRGKRLRLMFRNRTSRPIRISDFESACGYRSISFLVEELKEGKTYRIVRKERVWWTVNAPVILVVKAHKSLVVDFDLLDGTWTIPSGLRERGIRKILEFELYSQLRVMRIR